MKAFPASFDGLVAENLSPTVPGVTCLVRRGRWGVVGRRLRVPDGICREVKAGKRLFVLRCLGGGLA